MDSSSIISFNNDSSNSTFQTPLKGEYNNVSVHELALHAMRDRCLLLQRRINTLESDNMRLKLQTTHGSLNVLLKDDEKATLHHKIAELTKQKSQLMHHVFMVSCENKNLWNKISSIKGSEKSVIKDGKNPLIRTNTYIQSTPRTSANYQEKFSESSLEDISLKLINSYIQEKSQLVEQYEQMTQLQDGDDHILNADSIGFAYIEDNATDSLKEIHNQTEKLHNIKKEIAQQESDLKLILSRVETILNEGYKCPTCAINNARVVTSENKEIETSDSLMNWATPADSTTYNNLTELNTSAYKRNIPEPEKESTEPYDKICPMCGQTFQKVTAFAEFQSHVENHFMGESEIDSTLDHFENIPNSFDNII